MKRLTSIIVTLGIIFISIISEAFALEVFIPSTKVIPGQSIDIPVMIDQIDNLAGIQINMTYDQNVLTYVNAFKSRETSPLIHIVNSKKPGVLIIVMAAGMGISGKNFPLITLTFNVRKEIDKNKKQVNLDIIEIKLMSDQLKYLKSNISIKPVEIIHSPVK